MDNSKVIHIPFVDYLLYLVDIPLMWLKQYHELPMTGNGHHTTYENGDNWGMVCYCFTNVNHKSST